MFYAEIWKEICNKVCIYFLFQNIFLLVFVFHFQNHTSCCFVASCPTLHDLHRHTQNFFVLFLLWYAGSSSGVNVRFSCKVRRRRSVISQQSLPVFTGSAVRMGQWARICTFALNNLTWTVKKCCSLLCAEQTVKCLWCCDWGVRGDCFSLDFMNESSWTGLDECVESQVF